MTQEKERGPQAEGSPQSPQVDTSRRRFTRLGAGAPVLMSLASQPVFGVNCLSNGMSGNMSSDPDRMNGSCEMGYSPDELLTMNNWGTPYTPYTEVGHTPLAQMSWFVECPAEMTLKDILEADVTEGIRGRHKVAVAAMVNTNPLMGPNYVMSHEQFEDLIHGRIDVPYNVSLVNYLRWTVGR